jgi:hypothetical protein
MVYALLPYDNDGLVDVLWIQIMCLDTNDALKNASRT